MISVSPWLHRFAFLTSFLTVLLLAAGALVTSTGSGLAVPDWPLSFGQLFPPMVGGVFYEHGHRMVAGTVAICTVALALFFWKEEPRPWVKRLAVAAVLIVFTQALLGGLTVLFKLPIAVSVSHACLAQIFFSLTAVLVLVTSSAWKQPARPLAPEKSFIPLRTLCVGINVLFFSQLLVGAIMRHKGAGLAIPDFPKSFGHWVPEAFPFPVLIHYLHRVGALLIVLSVSYLAARLFRRQPQALGLIANAGALAGLVGFQLVLGAFVIWLKRPVPLTTAHLVVGALCLATSVLMTLQVFRYPRPESQP